MLTVKDLAPYDISLENDSCRAVQNLGFYHHSGLHGLDMRSSLARDTARICACAQGNGFSCFHHITASMRLRIKRRGMPLSE